jgi:predicted DNA-binding transcriptional regulator AlpA
MPHENLIDENEAASRLGLSVKTLRKNRWKGRRPYFIKLGKSVRYEPSEIEDFIQSGRRTGTK